MGIWAWFLDLLTEPRAPTTSPPRCASADRSGSAIAVASDADPAAPNPATAWWKVESDAPVEALPPPRPEMSAELVGLENLLVSHFDGHDLSLPPLVRGAERVLQLLSSRNCDLRKVANAISEDQVLTAAVLRMVNSPFYRGVQPISSVTPAVTRLGAKAVRTLMFHESVRAATFHGSTQDKKLAREIWERSIASAHIMRALAPLTRLDPEEAFMAGLLHDIGNIIALRIVSSYRSVRHEPVTLDVFDFLCHESHQEFGELLAAEWGLPENLAALIADHHTWPEPAEALRVERLTLILADMVAAMLNFGPPARYNLAQARPAVELGLAKRADWTGWLDALPDGVSAALAEN